MPIWDSYLLLGDWYAMEELQYWASWYLSNADPGSNNGGTDTFGRHGSWGLPLNPQNGRITAWHMRSVGYAYTATPTEDPTYAPMRTYLLSKMRLAYSWLEGVMNVQNGVFHQQYPTFSSWNCSTWNNTTVTMPGYNYDDPAMAWAWGRCNWVSNVPNSLHLLVGPFLGTTPAPDWVDQTKSGAYGDWWHTMYHDHVSEYLSRLGITDAETFLAKAFRPMWIDSVGGMNFLMSEYVSPIADQNINLFTSWAAMRAAHLPGFAAQYAWCAGGSPDTVPPNCNDFGYLVHHSYQHLYRAAVSLADTATGFTGLSGTYAAQWVNGNSNNQNNYGAVANNTQYVDPRFGWISQFIRNVQVRPGATQAVFRWSSFSADACAVGISASGFASTNSAGDASIALNAHVGSFVASGLSAGTVYAYRITCGPNGGTVRTSGTLTTSAAGSATTMTIAVHPPGSLNAVSAAIDYGPTAALGSSTGATACATACSMSIPATKGQALYCRVRYLDGAGHTLPAGSGIQTVIP